MITFLKDKLLENNLFFYLTLLLIPITVGLSSITLALSFIYGLIAFLINRKDVTLEIKRYFIISCVLFLYLIFSALYYANKDGPSLNILLKYLPVLFIPFYDLSIKKRTNLRTSTDCFIYLFVGILISLIIGVFRLCYYGYSFNYSNIEDILGIHPVYISMFILICINYLFYRNDSFKFFLILLFITSIILIRSRTSILVLVIIIGYNFLVSLKSNYQKIIIVFISIIVFVILVYYLNYVDHTKTSFLWALNERFQIWESSFYLFTERPILGYGLGNEYYELSQSFFIETKYNLMDGRVNSHNIFLSQLIQTGIIGLLLMITVFVYPLLGKINKFEYLGFLMIVFICGFTESYMYRHWGVLPILICGLYVSSSFKKYNNN
ncbi:O-antigen ligase family protein [Joostella atrarenae]|uniref:O-antigen ligase family protein n=1 Tax=Joostella atrarenae TaxID=679257 RepID=A0ABS9J391_9FLAO|nr:O-antigen ligase family protein [Joostella atrarenae]MCF8714892.1 O-antigen ligase family protein [Joostella atrarenae]